ncbi:MAG TPA: 50S ribosomal protein L10 [archaeon]|nr:50S ribosomal protein L10 [archaeon]
MRKDEKPQEVEKLKKLIKQYKVIGLLNMHKLPARQLLAIKQKLEGTAMIKMSKKTLLKRALDDSNGAAILFDQIKGEPALLLSNDNPFSLYRIIKESRSPAAAKIGDVATKDIVITQGSTGLPPGPAISVLQKVGLKASVQQGAIAILQDKTVCKSGDVVSEELASVLSLLKIEPMEIGLDLVAAYDGMLYKKDVLDVSTEDYINKILLAVQQSIQISLETGFLTKETVSMSIQKAFREAKQLAVDCSLIEKEFIDELMMKAIREAKLLEEKVNK